MKLIKAVESGQLCLRRGVLDNLFVPGMSKDSLKSCSDNAEKEKEISHQQKMYKNFNMSVLCVFD